MKTLALSLVALALFATSVHAEGCTQNHELSRIVPEYQVVMLDGNEIKRQLYGDWRGGRLDSWKLGHNITYCPDQDKMINTTINSIATLQPDFVTSERGKCNTRLLSDWMHEALEREWRDTKQGYASGFALLTAKSKLGWYYVVCTDHEAVSVFGGHLDWFDDKIDFKNFLIIAESLTSVDMAVEDSANASIYKSRAAQYKQWADALFKVESKKSFVQRIWEGFTK